MRLGRLGRRNAAANCMGFAPRTFRSIESLRLFGYPFARDSGGTCLHPYRSSICFDGGPFALRSRSDGSTRWRALSAPSFRFTDSQGRRTATASLFIFLSSDRVAIGEESHPVGRILPLIWAFPSSTRRAAAVGPRSLRATPLRFRGGKKLSNGEGTSPRFLR